MFKIIEYKYVKDIYYEANCKQIIMICQTNTYYVKLNNMKNLLKISRIIYRVMREYFK